MGTDGELPWWEPQLERLLEVTESLATAGSADAVVRTIVTLGLTALGAAYGGVWLLDDEDEHLHLRAVSTPPRATAEPWRRVPLDDPAPVPASVRDDTPIFIDSLADYAARFPASYERIRETVASDDASYAMIPLSTGGSPFGVLEITYDRAHAVGTRERTFVLILARHCALAVRRIELHEAHRAARLEAEEATRARDEILSVVSNDLRNPLNTISIGATMLQELVALEDPHGERVQAIAIRIGRQAERMARLLQDLVDFAGLDGGLTIERGPTRPEWIVTTAGARFAPVAGERGIGFEIEVPGELAEIEVDAERAVQVVSNLLANALKVTTQGGRVAAGVIGGPEVVFFVRDSGPGIEAQELPRLFERHWRSTKATYKGVGLGLSIARGIVDAHGGRIWAESQVGVGATFFFTLTPRA